MKKITRANVKKKTDDLIFLNFFFVFTKKCQMFLKQIKDITIVL